MKSKDEIFEKYYAINNKNTMIKINNYFAQITAIEARLREIDNGAIAESGEVEILHGKLFSCILGVKVNLRDLDLCD